jgi:GTPase involved in cell partitioning and DNA repair
LNKLQSLNVAQNGVDGRQFHMRGANAENLIIQVPVGTQINLSNGENIIDITKNEQLYVAGIIFFLRSE